MTTSARGVDLLESTGSVEEILMFFNFRHDSDLYLSEELLVSESPEPKRTGPPTGQLVAQLPYVDTRFFGNALKRSGFRLKSLAVHDRKRGLRASAVLIPERSVQHTAETLDELTNRVRIEFGFKILIGHLWDLRIHRNPGDNGGNLSIECGNPRGTRYCTGSYTLGIDEEGVIKLTPGGI